MNDGKPRMQKTVRHLAEQLAGIRTGTISIGFIVTVRVDCEASSAPIRQLGGIKQQGDRILITPFDKAVVPAIVRALNDAQLNAHSRELFDMLKPNCDICGKPATVHETVREAGEATSRHFCQEHGELRVIEEYYRRSLSVAGWESVARVYRLTNPGT